MALKTFNVDHEVYKEFSKHCKKHGISMSKRVENFIRLELENITGEKKKEPDPKGDFEKGAQNFGKGMEPKSEGLKSTEEEHSFQKYC
tara:strand:+ start:4076 stop:4339 length:264 start_codon:yes stop_codon:yes gene_type:complete